MSLYLKNNYYTKIEWFNKDFKVKITIPTSIIFTEKRPEIVKTFKLQENKIIINDNKEVFCPSYALRTAVAVDAFIQNIQCNIPCSEIYFFDQRSEKINKFAIKYLTLDLPKEELEKEYYLASILSTKEKRQTLSEEFDIVAGYEFVSSIIANGGL